MTTTAGYRHWLRTLRPYVERGYRHGLLTDHEIILICDVTEAELRLARPSARWIAASVAVPAMEPDDHDLDVEELRGIVYSMKRPGTSRQELSA